jgi:hypothetical protein
MGRTPGLSLAALAAALLGAAPTEQMLCFHQDGRIFLEDYQEDCCDADARGDCPGEDPSRCPDDQCHDLPLTLERDGSLDVPSVDAPPATLVDAVAVPCFQLTLPLEAQPPRPGGLDPPGSPPLRFLRTVVLRL